MKNSADKSEEVQREILRLLTTWYAKNLGVEPTNITLTLLENQMTLLIEDSQTLVEKLLRANLSRDLNVFFQASLSNAIKMPLRLIIEKVLVDVKVLEIFSERSLQTNRTGAIVILDKVPTIGHRTPSKSVVSPSAIAAGHPQKIELIETLTQRELSVLFY